MRRSPVLMLCDPVTYASLDMYVNPAAFMCPSDPSPPRRDSALDMIPLALSTRAIVSAVTAGEPQSQVFGVCATCGMSVELYLTLESSRRRLVSVDFQLVEAMKFGNGA